MPAQAVPDDRAVATAMQKLKVYVAYKAKQAQSGDAGPSKLDPALQTVEMWADDPNDDGKAWATKKETESNQKIQRADAMNAKVAEDDKQAAAEADARSKLDVQKLKGDMNKVLDDYEAKMKEQADAGQPWAKAKLAEATQQKAEGKQFVNQDLEKALDKSQAMAGQNRQKTKAAAADANQQAGDAKQWKQQYADNPGAHPAGQRADVQKALDDINGWAGQMTEQLQPYSSTAQSQLAALKTVQTWTSDLKKQTADPNATKAAKASGKSGVAQTRTTRDNVEKFLRQVETQGNNALDVFQKWTQDNNNLASKWASSTNPQQRQWAEAWQKTQQ